MKWLSSSKSFVLGLYQKDFVDWKHFFSFCDTFHERRIFLPYLATFILHFFFSLSLSLFLIVILLITLFTCIYFSSFLSIFLYLLYCLLAYSYEVKSIKERRLEQSIYICADYWSPRRWSYTLTNKRIERKAWRNEILALSFFRRWNRSYQKW